MLAGSPLEALGGMVGAENSPSEKPGGAAFATLALPAAARHCELGAAARDRRPCRVPRRHDARPPRRRRAGADARLPPRRASFRRSVRARAPSCGRPHSMGGERARDHRPSRGGADPARCSLVGAPPEIARLFGVLWSLKLIRMNAAFALLGRVLRNERQPLMSVTTAFVVVVLFAATVAFVARAQLRSRRPSAACRRRSGGR